jgi:tetratricopeptide (TPR) repeat protein
LKGWADQYGFSVEEVRSELNRWAADAESRRASAYDLGLAAFAINNFREANERALADAAEAEASLANVQEQELETVERAVRDYRLAGNAAYQGLEFEKAAGAYGRALSYVHRDRDAAEWANIQLGIGNSEGQLISRSEGVALRRHAETAINAYSLAFEVYKKETLPQSWAETQNNLGVVLRDLAGRSEGPQAAAYLEQSVAAFHSALQVRTRQQLPQDWAATQNGFGVALRDLAERSKGPDAATYLEQSVAACRAALQVRTEANFPAQWIQTTENLARTYEFKKDWSNARQSYEILLRHNPSKTELQSKVKDSHAPCVRL